MNVRYLGCRLLAGILVWSICGTAWAQGGIGGIGGGPGGFYGGSRDNPVGPTVSPYLNLLNVGNQLNGVPTYQALVKPLEDQRRESIAQQADISRLQRDVRQTNTRLRGTGSYSGGSHDYMRIRFQNHSHYYSFQKR